MLNAHFQKQLDSFNLDVSLTIGNNELLVVLGASGSGKSTLLNCMAGFIKPDKGFFELDKKIYNQVRESVFTPIYNRQIAYIQQGSTLFPHLTVKENIMYSIKKKNWSSFHNKYNNLLSLLDINELEHRKPDTLSGGQQQRVAIARCLMMNPKLILWDEPFSALDHIIREELRTLVLQLKKKLNIPMIFVTHDLDEAFQLADRLAIMEDGKILQIDDRDKVFKSPVNETVGKILGVNNILTATYIKESYQENNLVTFKCNNIILKGIDISSKLKEENTNTKVKIGIRPEQIIYIREEKNSKKPLAKEVQGNVFDAIVLSIEKHLENYKLKIKIQELKTPMIMHIPRGVINGYDIYEGKSIKVMLKYKSIIIMNVLDDLERNEKADKHTKLMKDKVSYKSNITISNREITTYNKYFSIITRKPKNAIVGIAGVSNSGKTTVMTQLISKLSALGYNIGTIKHDGHDFSIDQQGKDTYLHRKAGAKAVTIASRKKYSIIRQTDKEEVNLDTLIDEYSDMDLILIEGYKFSNIPKFEVVRLEGSSKGVCRKESLLGYITDVKGINNNIPSYGFNELDKVVTVIEKIVKEVNYER